METPCHVGPAQALQDLTQQAGGNPDGRGAPFPLLTHQLLALTAANLFEGQGWGKGLY